jgi:hypothetical protein
MKRRRVAAAPLRSLDRTLSSSDNRRSIIGGYSPTYQRHSMPWWRYWACRCQVGVQRSPRPWSPSSWPAMSPELYGTFLWITSQCYYLSDILPSTLSDVELHYADHCNSTRSLLFLESCLDTHPVRIVCFHLLINSRCERRASKPIHLHFSFVQGGYPGQSSAILARSIKPLVFCERR